MLSKRFTIAASTGAIVLFSASSVIAQSSGATLDRFVEKTRAASAATVASETRGETTPDTPSGRSWPTETSSAYTAFGSAKYAYPYTRKPGAPLPTTCRGAHCKTNATAPSDCQPIDFRAALPPVRDQDSIGWCYAFTAADLISFKLGQEVSAVDMALAYEESQDDYTDDLMRAVRGVEPKKRIRDGGLMHESIRAAASRGFCLEKNLPARDAVYATGFGDLKSRLDAITKLKEDIDRQGGVRSGGARAICSQRLATFKSVFPNLELDQLIEALDAPSSENIFDRLSKSSCGQRAKTKDPVNVEAKDVVDLSAFAKMQNVDGLLNSGRPVGVSYKVGVLGDVSNFGHASHASSVVGRVWNADKKTCEYIVRNSWGSQCHPGYKHDCDGGYVFIPREELANATTRLTHVD